MLAKKNATRMVAMFPLVAVAFLAGCAPPGERALNKGKKYLDQGRYDEAVQQLAFAANLLKTNANAWNCLGLASHGAGDVSNAVVAYQRAINLDRNLLEARFNLGCLWLDEGNFDAAKTEFIAYTLRRSNDVDGWLRRGSAELRAQESFDAERSYREALRLSTNNAEALNGLGLVQLQRKHPREAAAFLREACKLQPDYRPALLNLATVTHQHLNDPAEALRLYRAYLALQPRAEDWEAVSAIAKSLEPKPQASAQPRVVSPTNAAPVSVQAERPTPVVSNKPAPAVRVETPAQAKPSPAPTPVEVVRVPAEPVVKPVETPSQARNEPQPQPPVVTQTAPGDVEIIGAPKPAPAKKGFFARVFKRDPKTNAEPKAVSETVVASEGAKPVANASLDGSPRSSERYNYISPQTPSPGDRAAAERELSQGQTAYRARRFADAMQAYRRACQLDPGYFEAAYSLGLTAYEARSYKLALAAWENALAIRPESADARYNFGLTLKAANYPVDAANELERLLINHPNEARAHLTLGNLYAEQLRDPARARLHYNQVLQLDPRNPQATAIRYWMVENPP